MKERPILFNAEMVRAILGGRKNQTRRVVKEVAGESWRRSEYREHAATWKSGWWFITGGSSTGPVPCPYGQPGDRLWVKERIARGFCGDMNMSHYVADEFPTVSDAWPWQRDSLASIHCPRGLSRILLEITNVRVERLHQISEANCMLEGIGPCAYPRTLFRRLWDSINAKRGYGWGASPWVWVIEFRRINAS